jgi:PleD family two-component response regulator
MVTARGDMDSLANAFVAGATDYITKPVNRIELLARARAALRLKAELDRRQARERELLDFLASWGDRRATLWIDEATGLLVGEIAEAYLTAATDAEATEASLIALSIDRLPVLHAARGSEAVRGVLHQVAAAIKATPACIGTLAASYRNGLIVLVLPGVGLDRAQALAATLREAIAALQLANAEAIAADHVTVSIAAMTARIRSGADRVKLLTQTISAAQDAARSGGDRVVAASL